MQTQIKLREWKEGENLENLTEENIVRMYDCSRFYGEFMGLYQYQEKGRHVIISRENLIHTQLSDDSDILRWRLSGNGVLCRDDANPEIIKFLFDGSTENEDYLEAVNKNSREYDQLNSVLRGNSM